MDFPMADLAFPLLNLVILGSLLIAGGIDLARMKTNRD